MAKDKKLSHNFVKNLLIEDSVRYPLFPPNSTFLRAHQRGYKIYAANAVTQPA
jgi:hypothetical protein